MLTTGWARPTSIPAKRTKAQEQFQIYQQLRAQHLADLDKQRAEIRQFVYSEKNGPPAKP